MMQADSDEAGVINELLITQYFGGFTLPQRRVRSPTRMPWCQTLTPQPRIVSDPVVLKSSLHWPRERQKQLFNCMRHDGQINKSDKQQIL